MGPGAPRGLHLTYGNRQITGPTSEAAQENLFFFSSPVGRIFTATRVTSRVKRSVLLVDRCNGHQPWASGLLARMHPTLHNCLLADRKFLGSVGKRLDAKQP